jgi:PAS domain S-box-containing protein
MESILQAWEDFAKTIEPPASTMDGNDFRDHAFLMLKAIANDLCNPQTSIEGSKKSKGQGLRGKENTAAELHAIARLQSGYTVNQLVSEYRALRFSVLHLWSENTQTGLPTDKADITRFNEAIDQALTESVARITSDVNENERQRLQAILEVVPVGIMVANFAGKLVLTNPESRRIWGEYPVCESLDEYGKWKAWWADRSEKHGQVVEAHEWPLARALRGAEAPSEIFEIEPFGQPGQRRTVLFNARPIRDGGENIVGSVVAQMDITEQVKAEKALRESEAKFRIITDAMPQMIWSTLPDGYHDYYNHQWYNFTGMPIGSTDGNRWNGMFHPDDQARAWELWQHSLATGENYEIQYRLRHHSGEYHWTLGRDYQFGMSLGKSYAGWVPVLISMTRSLQRMS